jgi:hypothetical protein
VPGVERTVSVGTANLLTADGLADMRGGGDFHSTLVEVTTTT